MGCYENIIEIVLSDTGEVEKWIAYVIVVRNISLSDEDEMTTSPFNVFEYLLGNPPELSGSMFFAFDLGQECYTLHFLEIVYNAFRRK